MTNQIEFALLLAITLTSLGVLVGLKQQMGKLMKIRVEEDTLNALIALAQSAVDADAHDKADLAALQATVAKNEEDLPDSTKAAIDALLNPPPPQPAPQP